MAVSLLMRACLVVCLGLRFVTLPAQTTVQFVDLSNSAGVGVAGRSYGNAWGDYDEDGRVDLFVSFVGRPHILYRNAGGGVFENVSQQAGMLDDADPAGEGSVFADYDGDGHLDLFVTNGCKANPQSPNVLYRNNGDGTFTRRTQEAGLHYVGPTQGTAWADFDLDGFIDLYVGLLETANPNTGNFLYRNNHNGTFTNVAAAAGVADTRDSNGGVAWADYNNDGYPDLYVANRNDPNALFRNNRDGTFADVAVAAGVAGGENSEAPAWGDYDNDGWLDLFVATIDGGDKLYRNNRDGTFTNVTTQARMDLPGLSVGANWADFDNDGWLDLLVVNEASSAPNRLFRNNGDGTFTDVAATVGLSHQEDFRVGAWADIDNDGFLDLFLSNWAGKNRLFRNTGNGNRWLVVRPLGAGGNRDGIGVRIEATAVIDGQVVRQTRELSAGGSRHSQDSLPLEFGLGSASSADLVVTFPGGPSRRWGRVAANQTVVFREGNKQPFTDNALTAASSVIRAVHITELRARIDALRARYGLAGYPYADAPISAGTTVVQARHITDLRAALKDAYNAAQLTELIYTDSMLLGGMPVRAAHVDELRAGVIAIE